MATAVAVLAVVVADAGVDTATIRAMAAGRPAAPYLGALLPLRIGLAALAGTGVAVGFAFFFFDQICGSLGKAEVIPAFAAAWAPPILALLSGFTLLTYTEDG